MEYTAERAIFPSYFLWIAQKLNKDIIKKSPDIIRIIADNVETNYPVSNLINDIKLVEGRKSDIVFRTVEGKFEADDSSVVFYDINNGEIVSVVSVPENENS